jgi:hypothetical protein
MFEMLVTGLQNCHTHSPISELHKNYILILDLQNEDFYNEDDVMSNDRMISQ